MFFINRKYLPKYFEAKKKETKNKFFQLYIQNQNELSLIPIILTLERVHSANSCE